MTLELHVFPPSPRAFKVLAVANHLGLDYEMRLVHLGRGEQRSPEFARLNPNQRMPVLRDGDYVLWESGAILQYLALRRPQAGLLPLEERTRLDVTRWQFWELAHWEPPLAVFVYENFVKQRLLGLGEADRAALEKATPQFHHVAGILEAQLRGRRYVTGEALTIADFALGSSFIIPAGFPLEPYPEIRRWHASLSALPAWTKALASAAAVLNPASSTA
jgi:glutathione S-transferase